MYLLLVSPLCWLTLPICKGPDLKHSQTWASFVKMPNSGELITHTRCYRGCQGDKIRHRHKDREEIGLLVFRCGAKTQSGPVNRRLLLLRQADRGSQHTALRQSDLRRQAENKAVSWCIVLLGNRSWKARTGLKSRPVCVCMCVWMWAESCFCWY